MKSIIVKIKDGAAYVPLNSIVCIASGEDEDGIIVTKIQLNHNNLFIISLDSLKDIVEKIRIATI